MTWGITGFILVMLGCGIVGGYAGHLLSPPTTADLKDRGTWWWVWRSIFLGIVAAFLVPLFLKLFGAVVGSETGLLNDVIKAAKEKATSWFVFAGFCLIAAASAQRFVSYMTDSVLSQMQRQIKEVDRKAEVAKQKAEDAQDEADAVGQEVVIPAPQMAAAAVAPDPLEKPAKKILISMAKPELRRASPRDIAYETGIVEDEVQRLLGILQEKELVEQRKPASDGSQRWRLKTQGRALADQLKGEFS